MLRRPASEITLAVLPPSVPPLSRASTRGWFEARPQSSISASADRKFRTFRSVFDPSSPSHLQATTKRPPQQPTQRHSSNHNMMPPTPSRKIAAGAAGARQAQTTHRRTLHKRRLKHACGQRMQAHNDAREGYSNTNISPRRQYVLCCFLLELSKYHIATEPKSPE
jgi:hypothetical protein